MNPVAAAPASPVVAPPAGVRYPQVLRGPDWLPVKSWLGLAFALFGYALLVPLVNQLGVGLAWLVSGRPGTFAHFFDCATRYEVVLGMVAGHLALGTLILLSMAMVRWWHRRSIGWLHSVQPGMRWRYLLVMLPVAVVVLNTAMWLVSAGKPVAFTAPTGWPWWVLAIILVSPLQAAGEEYFFRGYLLQAFGSLSRAPWVGVVASATLFALFHGTQNIWLFLDRLGFGLLAGLLVVLTGGLEAGIAAHVANNVFAFGYATFSGGVSRARAVQQIGPAQLAQDLLSFSAIALIGVLLSRRMQMASTTPGAPAPARQ